MTKYTKEELANYFFETYTKEEEHPEFYREEAKCFVNQLYDLSLKKVSILSEKRTEAFRIFYGIYHDGVWQSARSVASHCHTSYVNACQMSNALAQDLELILGDIPKAKLAPLDKMSSVEQKNLLQELRNKIVWELGLQARTLGEMRRKNVITVANLSCHGLGDFRLGEVGRCKLLEGAHALGFSFIEELPFEKRKEIVASSSKEDIDRSSASWLLQLKDYPWYSGLARIPSIADLRRSLQNGYHISPQFLETASMIGIDLLEPLPPKEPDLLRSQLLLKQQRLTQKRSLLLEEASNISGEILQIEEQIRKLDEKEKVKKLTMASPKEE